MPSYFIIALIMFGVFLFVSLLSFIMSSLILKDTAKIPDTITRLARMEQILQTIFTTEQINNVERTFNQALIEHEKNESNLPPPGGKSIWTTRDGKYTGESIDDLLEKMAGDPSYGITKEDLDALKRFFEQISNDPDENDNEDIQF